MDSSSDEGTATVRFTAGVSKSAERELAIDEKASTVSLSPNCRVVPNLSVSVRKKVCVRDFLDHQKGEESVSSCQILGEEADDDDSFVNIISGITAVGDAESEVWKFADALARASLSVETLAHGVVDTSHLPIY